MCANYSIAKGHKPKIEDISIFSNKYGMACLCTTRKPIKDQDYKKHKHCK